jgi:hypothetical protein
LAISAVAVGLALRHARLVRWLLLAMMLAVLAGATWRFVRGQYWLDREKLVMTFYLVPMYLLALGWAAVMLRQPALLGPAAVWVDALAVVIGGSRTLTNIIPASGHVVVLLYSILVTPHRGYRLAAGIYLALALAMKFVLWHDVFTPVLGGVIAYWLWRLRKRAMRGCANDAMTN